MILHMQTLPEVSVLWSTLRKSMVWTIWLCASALNPTVKPADGIPCIPTVNLVLWEVSDLVYECGTVTGGVCSYIDVGGWQKRLGATIVNYKQKTAIPVPSTLGTERKIKTDGNVIKDCTVKHIYKTALGSHLFCHFPTPEHLYYFPIY